MKIPNEKECLTILSKNNTPENVIKHSKAVCKAALEIADKLIAKGVEVNRELVLAGALLHDIERDKKDHSIDGAKKLEELGFKEVAEVAKKHGLYHLKKEEFQPKTIEEKIVFYADKLAHEDERVTFEERYRRAAEKYPSDDWRFIHAFTKKIEKELKEMMG